MRYLNENPWRMYLSVAVLSALAGFAVAAYPWLLLLGIASLGGWYANTEAWRSRWIRWRWRSTITAITAPRSST